MVASPLLTEHLRSGRERNDKWTTVRREAYADYLAALHDANEALRTVSLGEHSPDLTRKAAARSAFHSAGVTKAREHIILIAPETVIAAATEAFHSLRTMRDHIGQGENLAQYEPVLLTYDEHLHTLREAVRHDLGVTGNTPQIPL
ncbi:hypothetical protein [Spirillospora sp. NPDC047279]|uniref:hypothetical protein n=1 Tax=Spirillospora sp. NPDC047279 TaxID=3155478 RepID=UPI0033C305E7